MFCSFAFARTTATFLVVNCEYFYQLQALLYLTLLIGFHCGRNYGHKHSSDEVKSGKINEETLQKIGFNMDPKVHRIFKAKLSNDLSNVLRHMLDKCFKTTLYSSEDGFQDLIEILKDEYVDLPELAHRISNGVSKQNKIKKQWRKAQVWAKSLGSLGSGPGIQCLFAQSSQNIP